MLDDVQSVGGSVYEETQKKILAAVVGVTNMKPGSLSGLERLDQLSNWDSLAAFDFILEMEKQLSVEITPDSLAKCETIEDLVKNVICCSTKDDRKP